MKKTRIIIVAFAVFLPKDLKKISLQKISLAFTAGLISGGFFLAIFSNLPVK